MLSNIEKFMYSSNCLYVARTNYGLMSFQSRQSVCIEARPEKLSCRLLVQFILMYKPSVLSKHSVNAFNSLNG